MAIAIAPVASLPSVRKPKPLLQDKWRYWALIICGVEGHEGDQPQTARCKRSPPLRHTPAIVGVLFCVGDLK